MVAGWGRRFAARLDLPRLIDVLPGRRTLVLSPHPDDDALGAGGSLLKQRAAGATVTTVVLTNGAAGSIRRQPDLVEIRRREENAAALILGISRVVFWDEPDGGLSASEANAQRLRSVLLEVEPDLVYLPFFLDVHPDHRTVTPLLERALRGTELSFACAAYEFATPLVPNVVVDVTAHMDAKLRAVALHASQAERGDYQDLVLALARWRSSTLAGRARYAEAFYLDEVHTYLALWRDVSRG